MKKKCKICQQRKLISEFNKHNTTKDRIGIYCRACCKIKQSKFKHLAQQFVKQLLKVSCCQDCGTSDIRVLEFDHLRDKKQAIANMVAKGTAVKTVAKEIVKCEIVCANCHRIRTYTRMQYSWRLE